MNNNQMFFQDIEIPDGLRETLEKAIENKSRLGEGYKMALKDQYPDHKNEIDIIAKNFEETKETPIEDFLQGTDKENKTKLAHAYADYQIQEKNTIPVLIDSATLFFRYQPEAKTWKQIDLEIIHKELDADLSSRPVSATVTQHLHNEFDKKMRHNGDYTKWEKFGLKTSQVLLKNGDILDLESNIGELEKDRRKAKKKDYALNAVNASFQTDIMEDYVHGQQSESKYATKLEKFITETIPDDLERETFQQFLGHLLAWPSDRFEKALLILGPTDSGKSTLLKVVKHFFKHANTSEISFPQLGQDRAYHVDSLKQSVINFDQDMSNKDIKRRSRIKKCISKESIFADPKMEKGYDMKPVANFMIASNHPPEHRGADQAFYNRFLTIEAPETISEDDKDRNLLDKLTTEECMDWLLAWAIDGYESLMTQNRFALDRDHMETKRKWSNYGDSVAQFINEVVERGTENSKNIRTVETYEYYEKWCEDNLEEKVSQQKFISRASDHPILTKSRRVPYDEASSKSCFVDIELQCDYTV